MDQWIQLENDLEVTAANQTASRTSENVTENDPLLYYVESISSDLSELVLAAGPLADYLHHCVEEAARLIVSAAHAF